MGKPFKNIRQKTEKAVKNVKERDVKKSLARKQILLRTLVSQSTLKMNTKCQVAKPVNFAPHPVTA